MRRHRIAPVFVLPVFLVLLAFSALSAAAQPARADAPAGFGQRWIELWQSFIAPFDVLTGDGRGAWDPNGGDPDEAVPSTIDDTADGRGAWDPNGNPL